MIKHWTVDCPPWYADGPQTRDGVFRQSCADAYRQAQAMALSKIVQASDCKQWHKIMFATQVPLEYYAGNFRQVDADWPCLNVSVNVAGIQGEAASDVISETDKLFANMQSHLSVMELQWPQLTPYQRAIRFAIILGTLIGRFIQVHPFVNGNGRTSRLLWAWGLMRFGVPPQMRIRKHPEDPNYNFIMSKAMQGEFSHLSFFILNHLTSQRPGLPVAQH